MLGRIFVHMGAIASLAALLLSAAGAGNAALAGRELPPAAVLAADRHLTALARSLKAGGALGTLDQIRAAVYLGLLSGRGPSDVLAGLSDDAAADAGATGSGPADPAAADPAAADPGTADPGTADADSASPDAAQALSWPAGPRGTIHLTMPLSAWLGQTTTLARLPALGRPTPGPAATSLPTWPGEPAPGIASPSPPTTVTASDTPARAASRRSNRARSGSG